MSNRLVNTLSFRICRSLLLVATLLLSLAHPTVADDARADLVRKVGDRGPLFTVVTNQEALADYNRDYYGRHHLVMTFFPAAFTPI